METLDIIMAVGALLGTGGFLTSLLQWYRAKPDREKVQAEREKLLSDVRATTVEQWRILANERQEEISMLRERLALVEKCLEDTRAELRLAQDQVAILEGERAQWQRERKSLLRRIEELEGCR